tara:strand:+ start:347 stop:607 length:261 start_codon:yes stop_codon:yes gene_type:complete
MRRRTGTRFVPITISLKPAVVDDIETELSPGQSRSKWIAEAIDAKLHYMDYDLSSITTKQLIAMLHARDGVSEQTRSVLMTEIKLH